MSHQLVNQSSGAVDYYTPVEWVEPSRAVLGEFTLDPASTEIANRTVRAKRIYTIVDNGLIQPWYGKVFINPPFHRGEKACRPKCIKKNCKPGKGNRGYHINHDIPSTGQWINKLVADYESGDVTEAIIFTFSSMSEGWMKPLLPYLQCFPTGRISYRKPDGTIAKAVTKGSLVTYFGPNKDKFIEVFSQFGHVK